MKKVKKFSRGGDILTGLGAGLAAYGAYKHFFGKDDQGKDTSTGVEKGTEAGKKKNLNILDEVAQENARKKDESKKDESKNAADDRMDSALKTYHKITSGDSSGSGGSDEASITDNTPVSTNGKKPRDDRKAGANNASSNTNKNNASSNANKDSGKSKPYPLNTVPNENRKSRPYPVNLPAVREIEHQKFLRTRAGLSGKGIPTPGNAKAGDKRGSTQKGRSENPIQGTIDNAFKSTVRSDADKMRERALEVDRRRQAEKKKKEDEAYMRELERGKAMRKGGAVKKYASGGSVKTAKPTMRSASSRADGIAIRGKTRA
jgi:hypothetical protein